MSNIENKNLKEEVKEVKGTAQAETKEFIKKFDLPVEEINKLERREVVLTRNKYGSTSLKSDLIPYLTHRETISSADYYLALVENGRDPSNDSVSYRVPVRFITGISKKDPSKHWFGVEMFISRSYRPRYFISDMEMLAINKSGKKLPFVEVPMNESDFVGIDEE